MAADTVIGPLTNQAQMQSLQAKLANARNSGLEELHGGAPNGLVLPPHVFGKVPAIRGVGGVLASGLQLRVKGGLNFPKSSHLGQPC